MRNLLQSTKLTGDVELLGVFGSDAYLGVNYKQIIKSLKRLFDDLFDGYVKMDELINGRESV